MRLFVSYSRSDAATVRPIVGALEVDGHDVWIDADDIRGSERWRTVVAEAIRTSDVVLLLVSPAAMSSSNVEREMAVAAEEAIRIIPVVIEAAALSTALMYDLAGVQRVSFIDRPFEEGMADLLAALVVQPTTEVPDTGTDQGRDTQSTVPPVPPRNRNSSRRLLYGLIATGVLLVAVVVVRQLSTDDDARTDQLPGERSAANEDSAGASVVDSETSDVEALTSAVFDTTVWFAGFSIQATRAVYDEATGDLGVDVVFTNEQPATSDPLRLLLDSTALIVDGTRFMLFCTSCSRLPTGTSSRAVLDAYVGGEVDLRNASIEFGTTDQHQAVVPLDGGPGTTDLPTTQALDGTLVDADHVTFTVEQLEIVPAGCSGPSSDLSYIPGPADEVSLVVVGTALSTERYGTLLGDARLTIPDGQTLASSSLSGYMYALTAGMPQPDVRACFAVPLPLSGDYSFTVAHADAVTFPDPIVIAL